VSLPLLLDGTQAYAIYVGARWFVKWDRSGRALTAWSLAGATLFSSLRDAEAAMEFGPPSRRREPNAGFCLVIVGEEQPAGGQIATGGDN